MGVQRLRTALVRVRFSGAAQVQSGDIVLIGNTLRLHRSIQGSSPCISTHAFMVLTVARILGMDEVRVRFSVKALTGGDDGLLGDCT